jgi:hypothetical protein
VSPRAGLYWLLLQLVAIAAGIAAAMWLFDVVTT